MAEELIEVGEEIRIINLDVGYFERQQAEAETAKEEDLSLLFAYLAIDIILSLLPLENTPYKYGKYGLMVGLSLGAIIIGIKSMVDLKSAMTWQNRLEIRQRTDDQT